jgi:hypothetical protein
VSLLLPVSLLAQLGAGQIEGTVTDPSDALIPNAKVTITNTATGVAREFTTDSGGRYRAVSVEPGPYSVKVEASGFAPLERRGIDVIVGQTATVDITLRVGGTGETVVVEDAAPLVPTESTEVSNTVPKEVVENVPSIGRRFDNFVLLAPGVSTDGSFGLISYRGVSGLYNNNTVDGADNNQAFFSEARGRTRAVYTYSQSAVKEFQVSLSNFTAESGNAVGGLVNAVTKSGTNSIHGEAFYFIRDSAVGASDKFAAPTALLITGDRKLPERRQQYGFSIGGPIKKDKLFWFLNYDEQHRTFPYVVSTSSPTFAVQVDTDCTTAFPGVTQFNINQRATCQFLQSQLTVVDRKGLNNVALGKLDWVVNQNHNLSVSYNYHQWRGRNNIRTPLINFNAGSDNGIDRVRTDSWLGRWNYVISPRLLNEFKFQLARDNESQDPNAPGPSTTISGAFSIGMPDFLPRPKYPYEDRYQWTDNLSWIRGRHTFKFGANINYVRETQINLFQGGGVYSYTSFNNLAGDCPAEAVALGCVPDGTRSYSSYTQAFDERVLAGTLPLEQSGSAFFTTNDWSFYAQDIFKLRSNVTLNLGVRYEYQQLPPPIQGNPLLPLSQSFPQDKNNFGPRVGVSWDVAGNQKTVLHAGYGIVYGRTSNSAIAQALLNNGVIVRTLRFTTGTVGAPLYPNCFSPAPNTTCATDVSTLTLAGQIPDVSQFSADFARPMVHQAELTLEHEIFSDTVLRLTYAHSGGRRLPLYRDVNLPAPSAEVFLFLNNDLVANGETLASSGLYGPFPFYTGARPDPVNFRRIIQAESVVNSSYDALIVQLRRRMKRGLLFDAHFTWAKAIDNGQNSLTFFGRSNTVFDPLNPSLDRSVSDFDIRRRFVSTFLWRPDDSFPIGNSTARAIFGRWQLSGTVTAQDGKPTNGTLNGFLSSGTGAVDTGSANGTGGNFRVPFLARNFGQALGFAVFDFRISKSIPVTEGTRLEFIAESFNLLNRVNVAGVGSGVSNGVSTIAMNIASSFTIGGGTCGGAAAPNGARCVTINPATDYLAPRSASSTHNGMRDVQFAFKFHW